MAITFGTAKKILAQYAGRGGQCATSEDVPMFVREVLEYMLISGQYGNLRKFCFKAEKGCFTIPYELEVPLKVKINGKLGSVWDTWFEWHYSSANNPEWLDEECLAGTALREEIDRYPTVYNIPDCGARVGFIATCAEAEDAFVVVKGTDATGREIFTTNSRGQQVAGVEVSLKKGTLVYSKVNFSKITAVIKPKTNGYVNCLWYIPDSDTRGFLSDYSPLEEIPMYRRFRISSPQCGSVVKVSVLGRIRLKENYADDDLIPFDNLYALSVAGQSINSNYNSDPQQAVAKDNILQTLIERETSYKRPNVGAPVEVYYPLSNGCTIKNIQ